MNDLHTELSKSAAAIDWADLIPHARRDAVIVVNPQLDLATVGVAIAEDNTNTVQAWIGEKLITKPTQTDLNAWNNEPTKKFLTIIVQPFVLVQEDA